MSATMTDTGNLIIQGTPTPLISKRLSLIIPPAKAKNVQPKSTKNNLSKIKTGSLKKFLDFPLDVTYEIFSLVGPLDLLVLARLSKDFRARFMSRSAMQIWKRVLGGVAQLPPCPLDMCEPEYASLIFDTFCMACGSYRGIIQSFYELRLRLCATCAKTNIVSGSHYALEFGQSALSAFKYVPSCFPEGYTPQANEINARDGNKNNMNSLYFKPELHRMLRELMDRMRQEVFEPQVYTKFVTEQHTIATRMMNEGQAMIDSSFGKKLVKVRKEAGSMHRLQQAGQCLRNAMDAMISLGWEEKYFPQYDSADRGDTSWVTWLDLILGMREFTAENWNAARPVLEELYQQYKAKLQKREQMRQANN